MRSLFLLLFFGCLAHAAAQSAETPRPDSSFKIECRLLEMPAEKADLIARTLFHSTIEHEKEARLIRETLAGEDVKNLAVLNGQSARDGKVHVEGLEIDGLIGPDAKVCDLDLAFHFDAVLQGMNTLSGGSQCSIWNDFPAIAARTDHGRTADLVMVWVSWEPAKPASPAPAEGDGELKASNAAPDAAGKKSAPDQLYPLPAMTAEVRLIELPTSSANLVETALVEWDADPEEQSRRLTEILSKNEVRRIVSLSTNCRSGCRSYVKNMNRPAAIVAHGEDEATPAGVPEDIGDSFELEPVIGPDGVICDLNCVYRRTRAFDGNRRIGTLQTVTSVTVKNGLPVLLSRCDHGKSSELVLVRVTFPTDQAPKSDLHLSTSQVYVRGRVVSIGHEFSAEASRLKDDPRGLARWLQQHGTTESIVSIVTKSGQRALFEDTEKQAYRLPDQSVATYTSGPSLEVAPVIKPGNASIALNAVVNDYQPRGALGAMSSRVGGRYLKGDVSIPTGIAIGGAAAAPCGEFSDPPSKGLPALQKLTPTDDVFIVFEPLMSHDHSSSRP